MSFEGKGVVVTGAAQGIGRAVAKAYRQRVLAEHTGAHRARELEDYLAAAKKKNRASRLPAEIGESVA